MITIRSKPNYQVLIFYNQKKQTVVLISTNLLSKSNPRFHSSIQDIFIHINEMFYKLPLFYTQSTNISLYKYLTCLVRRVDLLEKTKKIKFKVKSVQK